MWHSKLGRDSEGRTLYREVQAVLDRQQIHDPDERTLYEDLISAIDAERLTIRAESRKTK